MGGGAADRLDDPCGQAAEIVGDTPVTAGGALVQPCKLAETVPFVIQVIFGQIASARFQRHDLDALLRQLIRQCSATGARADDDNHAVV